MAEEERETLLLAAWCLLAWGTGEDVTEVLEVLRRGEGARPGAVARALELSERPALSGYLLPLLEDPEEAPQAVAAALEVLTVRGESPGPALLRRLLAHPTPEVRRAALRAARRFPHEAAAAGVRQGLSSAKPELRAEALVTGQVLGLRAAWHASQEVSHAPDAAGRTARLLLALGGEARDVEWLAALLSEPALRRDTLWALGFSGHPVAVEACLPWLADPEWGPLAAEAIAAITGLKLEGRLVQSREEEAEEEELSKPVAAEVVRWWDQARKGFDAGTRYLGGRPYTAARLVEALAQAPMRRRGPLALELTLRGEGQLAVEPRTWATRQLQQLQAVRAATGLLRMAPFSHWMNR